MKNSSSDFNYFVTYYKYDKNNKLIETREGEKRKMFKEKITETIKYQYNENGDCVIEEEYEGKSLIKKKEHKYENHKLIETISWQWFEGFGYYTKKIYKYNEDGTIKFIIHNSSETKEFSEKNNETTFYHYIYDNNNRLIEFQEIYKGYIPYKKTITYSDFDNKGNWQLKITNDNGRKEKVKRRFVYFED